MNMSVYERRHYLGQLMNENTKRSEAIDKQKQDMKNGGTKGSRTSTVSGDMLKAKLQSGEIPNV